MTRGDEAADEITVLIRVLDLLELSMRNRGLTNNEAVQINQVVNQFLGSTVGTIVQTQHSPGTEVKMGDEYKIGDNAKIGAVGKGARVDHLSFSMSDGGPLDIPIPALLEDLNKLRLEMRRQAATTEEDKSVVAIGDAISVAQEGDAPGTLAHLKSAGKWALAVASSIGAGVAAAAIKTALGL